MDHGTIFVYFTGEGGEIGPTTTLELEELSDFFGGNFYILKDLAKYERCMEVYCPHFWTASDFLWDFCWAKRRSSSTQKCQTG